MAKKDREISVLGAESAFITDADRHTVDYWYDKLLRNVCDLDWLRKYALTNKWHERRSSFWKGVQAAWLRQRHVKLVHERFEELVDIQQVRAAVLEMLRPVTRADGTKHLRWEPKSLGELVRAFVQLEDLSETKRDLILNAIDPMLASAEQQAGRDQDAVEKRNLPFSRAEMRSMAHQMLAKRITQRRKELGIEDDDDGDDDESEGKGPKEIEAQCEVTTAHTGGHRDRVEGKG